MSVYDLIADLFLVLFHCLDVSQFIYSFTCLTLSFSEMWPEFLSTLFLQVQYQNGPQSSRIISILSFPGVNFERSSKGQ